MDPDGEPAGLKIEISDAQPHLQADHAWLAALAGRVLAAEGRRHASLSIALVDDATIHEINRRHLGHDWPTDVISFVLSDADEPALAGELVISAEMAATVAREAGADPRAELALYLVHGLLHLCGYDDQRPDDVAAMRRREDELLAAEGLANTFPMAPARPVDAGRESARWPV